MAEAKIILFDAPSKMLKDGTFPIVLRVTHARKRKYFSLGKNCTPDQWNSDSSRFKKNFPNFKAQNDVLLKLETRASDIIRDFERDEIPFSFKHFELRFLNENKQNSLQAYFEQWIKKLLEAGKIGTASPYSTTLNAIIEFSKSSKLYDSKALKLTDISYKFLIEFEHWLRVKRNCKDTSISVYMRTLRSILNKAIREKIIKRDHYAFDDYRISERLKTETTKRTATKDAIKSIEDIDLDPFSALAFARDIFLFSYYTRGMNFVDIAYLEPQNVLNDRIFYIRRKTGKSFNIKLLPQAKKILDFYMQHRNPTDKFIFPIFDESIHATEKQKYDRRKTALRDVNKQLKKLAAMAGLNEINLTSYVSRHTYANVLKQSGARIAQISEAMGHQSEKVTEIYLKAFENTELDEIDANAL